MNDEQLIATVEHGGCRLRPCEVKGEPCVLHLLFVRTWTHGASIEVGGFPAGQESAPYALVEDRDGKMEMVPAMSVRMLDREDER